MADNWTVEVDPSLIARCWQYGRDCVASFNVGNKSFTKSRAFNGEDSNIELQAFGKMAECAFCLSLKIDPLKRLDWQTERAGAAADLVVRGKRIDVKGLLPHYKRILWHIGKQSEWADRPVDLLVAVREIARPKFEIWRWITKDEFTARHLVATEGDGTNLHPGSWHVGADQCHTMDDFKSVAVPVDPAIITRADLQNGKKAIPVAKQPFEPRCCIEGCGQIAHWGEGVLGREVTAGRWYCNEHRQKVWA